MFNLLDNQFILKYPAGIQLSSVPFAALGAIIAN